MYELASPPPALGLVGHHTDCGDELGGLGAVEGPGQTDSSRVERVRLGLTTPYRQPSPPRP
jgi:hypothetical protein